MGGLALLARELGYRVSGSDANAYPPMSLQLEAQGITLCEGYEPSHLDPTPDLVVIGNALSRGNPAVEYVLAQGLPYTSGPQWLAEHVLPSRWVLGVAGTHGKTSTASMLAWLLEDNGLRPGFMIGGIPANFGVSARVGDAPFFVVEADEYDHTFLGLRPQVAVVTTVEWDHPDIYPSYEDLIQAFSDFVNLVPPQGQVIGCGDDPGAKKIIQRSSARVVSYGVGAENDWQAVDMKANSHGGYDFRVAKKDLY